MHDRIAGHTENVSVDSDVCSGEIDEVAVYTRVLAAERIAAHHRISTTSPPGGRAG